MKQNKTQKKHLYIYICLIININQTLAFTILAFLLSHFILSVEDNRTVVES